MTKLTLFPNQCPNLLSNSPIKLFGLVTAIIDCQNSEKLCFKVKLLNFVKTKLEFKI